MEKALLDLGSIVRYLVIINIIALIVGFIAKKAGYMKVAKILSKVSLIGISSAFVFIAIVVFLYFTGAI